MLRTASSSDSPFAGPELLLLSLSEMTPPPNLCIALSNDHRVLVLGW